MESVLSNRRKWRTATAGVDGFPNGRAFPLYVHFDGHPQAPLRISVSAPQNGALTILFSALCP